MNQNNHFFPGAVAFLCGLIVCLGIASATGRNEAWDSTAYYLLGIPLMCIGAFVLGFLHPAMPWRWALWMAAGQAFSAMLGGSSLNLLPLAMIFMAVISIPQFIAAWLGARQQKKGRAA